MNKKWLFILIPVGAAACVYLGGIIVQLLWNRLAPALFGWKLITFWQAFGLLVLCRILFGGWGGGDNRGGKRRERKHWHCMSPEEHEQFREWTRSRPGGTTISGSGEPA